MKQRLLRIAVYWKKVKEMNARKKAYLISFLVLLGIFLWSFLSADFLTTGFNRSQVKTGANKQEVDVSSMILTETRNDQKYWEIYGESGTYDSDVKVALLTSVIGNFYKNNEVAMSFESSRATYNENKKQIILYNKTFIVIKDGIYLKCDRLVWSGSDKPIIAEGNVSINKDDELLAVGDKVIISPNYDRFTLKGHSVSKIFDKNGKAKKGSLFKW